MVEADGRRSSVLYDGGLTRAGLGRNLDVARVVPAGAALRVYRSSSVNSAAVIPIRRRMPASVPAGQLAVQRHRDGRVGARSGLGCLRI